MDEPDRPIVSVLPPREGFSPDAFGAISLSVRDFTQHSRYRPRSLILGAIDREPFPQTPYEALRITRHWYEPLRRAYVRAMVARLNVLNPALVEVHNRPVLALMLRKRCHAALALHLHNDPQEMKAAKTPAQRAALLQRLEAVYCISHWVRARFLDGLPEAAGNKVFTIHSGLEMPDAPAHKQPHIVFVGRMTPNKGARETAQALARVLPSHPGWHGYLIGGRRHAVSGRLSAYERDVQRLMEQAGERAHFEGFYPYEQTRQAFRDAAIVVVPSLWEEPFGRTALEAIAHGCAVITSGRGGLSEIIGAAGVIVENVTGEHIAQALERLITDEARRNALQAAAREQAASFAIERCTARLDELRAAILSNTHSSHRLRGELRRGESAENGLSHRMESSPYPGPPPQAEEGITGGATHAT